MRMMGHRPRQHSSGEARDQTRLVAHWSRTYVQYSMSSDSISSSSSYSYLPKPDITQTSTTSATHTCAG